MGPMIGFEYDDGGRADAGFTGKTGDCVTRAVAIVTGRPYLHVYAALAQGNATERRTRRTGKSSGKRSARNGIRTGRKWFKDYMAEAGFEWTPTMGIGTGCTVHLRRDELPPGRLVVKLSGHLSAVIDGVVHDIYNPDRGGERCVYGYYRLVER